MLDSQTLETEVNELTDILNNLKNVQSRELVVLIRQTVIWVLNGPKDEPPSGVLRSLTQVESGPYPLKPSLREDVDVN
jgi:hypothetical protein